VTGSEPTTSRAGDSTGPEKHSPLEEAHIALGAKMVGFGGWRMPLSYPGGTIAEHQACRTDAVVFDVSHLGTVRVEGSAAFDLLQSQLSNDLRKVRPGRAQYTHLLDDADGSVTDDIIVWWLREDLFDVMPNASNTARVLDALGGKDTTAGRAILAVQGPYARAKLSSVSEQAASVPRFGVASFEWLGSDCLVAGTGYTGEDGVECSVPVEVATSFFEAVMGAGIRPAGLGARDTLRLEAGLPLHGHELGPGITPLQCGLGWVVGWDKETFRGKAALERERRAGPARLLKGLVADGRRPPRDGNQVELGSRQVGRVTSGNFSPVLGRGIALAFLETSANVTYDDDLVVRARESEIAVRVIKPPFVRDGKPAVESAALLDQG
jgi:aminomethyltransferase